MKDRKIVEEKVVDKMFGDFKPASWYELWFYLKPYWRFRDVKYWFKKQYQKLTIGFPREEARNLRHASAKWMVPRLKQLKKEANGFPAGLIEDNELDTSHILVGDNPDYDKNWEVRHEYGMKKWQGILDQIIWSFENQDDPPEPIKPENWDSRCNMIKYDDGSVEYKHLDKREWDFSPLKEHDEKVKEGLKLFAEHYLDLWT